MTDRETKEVYVFLMRRPKDTQEWPVVYESRERAEANEFRVSDVVPLTFQKKRGK